MKLRVRFESSPGHSPTAFPVAPHNYSQIKTVFLQAFFTIPGTFQRLYSPRIVGLEPCRRRQVTHPFLGMPSGTHRYAEAAVWSCGAPERCSLGPEVFDARFFCGTAQIPI
jgi:hypothetical protein